MFEKLRRNKKENLDKSLVVFLVIPQEDLDRETTKTLKDMEVKNC